MNGRCRACGADLVDWERVHRRDLCDARYTFNALRFEMIRHHFWHVTLTAYAVNYARRKGRRNLRLATARQIRKLVGGSRHVREGYQTPRETSSGANAIHYAQHATASCCRRCIAEWHGIPEGRALTESEIEYLADLATLYIEARVPDLLEEPVIVPSQRSAHRSRRRTRDETHAH
ncbi:MAG TPA: DUF4186 family protein [Thermoanaerobaculia bacterium]